MDLVLGREDTVVGNDLWALSGLLGKEQPGLVHQDHRHTLLYSRELAWKVGSQ